jgi:hypothetical protein
VSGCFVAEPIEQLKQFGVDVERDGGLSDSLSAKTVASSWAAADWVRYPQVPGNLRALQRRETALRAPCCGRYGSCTAAKPIDVIHAHAALPCGHAASLLSRRLKIPFVVTVHGLDVFNMCSLEWDSRGVAAQGVG